MDKLTQILVRLFSVEDDDDKRYTECLHKACRNCKGEVVNAAKSLLMSQNSTERLVSVDLLRHYAYLYPADHRTCFELLMQALSEEKEAFVVSNLAIGISYIISGDNAMPLTASDSKRILQRYKQHINHPAFKAREGVAYALRALDAKYSYPLLKKLVSDVDPNIRDWSLFSLWNMKGEKPDEMRELFLKALEEPSQEIQDEALRGLAFGHYPEAEAELINALSSGRMNATLLTAIEEMKSSAFLDFLRPHLTIPCCHAYAHHLEQAWRASMTGGKQSNTNNLLKKLHRVQLAETDLLSTEELFNVTVSAWNTDEDFEALLKERKTKELFNTAQKHTEDCCRIKRTMAYIVLGTLPEIDETHTEKIGDILYKSLLDEQNILIYPRIAPLLAAVNVEKAKVLFSKHVSDPREIVRYGIARSLEFFPFEEIREWAYALLEDIEPTVRYEILSSLLTMPEELDKTIIKIFRKLLSDSNQDVQEMAIIGLATQKDPRIEKRITNALESQYITTNTLDAIIQNPLSKYKEALKKLSLRKGIYTREFRTRLTKALKRIEKNRHL